MTITDEMLDVLWNLVAPLPSICTRRIEVLGISLRIINSYDFHRVTSDTGWSVGFCRVAGTYIRDHDYRSSGWPPSLRGDAEQFAHDIVSIKMATVLGT